MNFVYITSQIITILMFLLIGLSYYQKKRDIILLCNIFAQICQIVSTLLLKGITGALMSIVMLISYYIMYIDYKFNHKKSKKRDTLILFSSLVIIVLITITTFNGYAGLIVGIATAILLLSLWQRNLKIYKYLGVIATLLWLIYYNSLKSFFGVILNGVLIISTLYSFKKNK